MIQRISFFFNLWRDTSSCLPNVRHLTFLILLLCFFFLFFATIDAGNPRQSIRFAIRICNEFVCSTAYRGLFILFLNLKIKRKILAHVGKIFMEFSLLRAVRYFVVSICKYSCVDFDALKSVACIVHLQFK